MPFTPIVSAPNSGKGDSQPAPAQPTTSGWMVASTWNGLFITEDEKKGWREIKFAKALNRTGGNAAAQIKVNAVVTNQKLPGAIFVGTDEGLFVSRDNGVGFQHLALPEAARRIRVVVCDPRDPETIYVGAAAGFFRSTDGGRSWESRGGGMPRPGSYLVNVERCRSDQLAAGLIVIDPSMMPCLSSSSLSFSSCGILLSKSWNGARPTPPLASVPS